MAVAVAYPHIVKIEGNPARTAKKDSSKFLAIISWSPSIRFVNKNWHTNKWVPHSSVWNPHINSYSLDPVPAPRGVPGSRPSTHGPASR